MDRLQLAAWSLGTPDAEFACALAALGALTAMPPPQVAAVLQAPDLGAALSAALTQAEREAGHGLRWTPPQADGQGRVRLAAQGPGRRAARVPAPDAERLANAWRNWMAARRAPQGPRLALHADSRQRPALLALSALLAHAAVGAASVYVDEPFAVDTRARWHWPFTIAVLPGDPLATALLERQRGLPAEWPFRLVVASRDTPRLEVLAFGCSAAPALARLIDGGLALKARLVVVTAGLGDDTPASAHPLLHALAARVHAQGVVVAGGNTGTDASREQGLWSLARELTHNQPLDVAVATGLGPCLQLLSADLLRQSRLDTAVTDVVGALRSLPDTQRVPLPDRVLQDLRLDPAAGPLSFDSELSAPQPAGALPPPDLAGLIETRRSDYTYLGESHEATAVAALSRQVRRQQAAAARSAEPRYVSQTSWQRLDGRLQPQRRGYVLGRAVLLRVDIGPRRARGSTARTVFPEGLLPPDADRHELQLVLYEPRQMDAPLTACIELPARSGRSTVADFAFTPCVAGPFEARLAVLHRGRVLQTLLLHTRVAGSDDELRQQRSRITLDDEAWVRHDWSELGRRRRFDLALVVNHSADGTPRATAVAGHRAWATDLSGVQAALQKINSELSAVATNVLDHAAGLDQGRNPRLLRELAKAGVELYGALYLDQLALQHTGTLDVGSEAVQSIQIVTLRADEVVPIEFIYDYDVPGATAQVCPQHRQALADGRCPGHCARRDKPADYVCPLGFWGLRKDIERHQFNARVQAPPGHPLVVLAETADGRDHLDLSAGLIIGHSTEVADADARALMQRLSAGLGHQVLHVADWTAWREAVHSHRPALLLAFPHNQAQGLESALEIGGQLLPTLGLKADFVHSPGGPAQPVVMLLGCDTAGSAEQYTRHVSWFRRAGAAVVVGTVATVFGKHALAVGDEIVSALLQPDSGDPARPRRLAEVIRDAKRNALLKSCPMALCVVAFGDADWQL